MGDNWVVSSLINQQVLGYLPLPFLVFSFLPLSPPEPPILRLSNFAMGAYRFTTDLLELELALAPLRSLPYPYSVVSPLRPVAWDRALTCIHSQHSY